MNSTPTTSPAEGHPRPERPRTDRSWDELTPERMRRTLGHFATGVTVVTGLDPDGEPVGFACQSFASVSLDPPLVLFCADHRGRSWPLMRDAGRFTVNVLAHDDTELVERFGSSRGRRFEGLEWEPSDVGGPALPSALVRVHARVEQVHPAGDHDVVIGRVLRLDRSRPGRPMLFYRGRFGVTQRQSASHGAEPVPFDDFWG